jgi:3-oxoacyl-[acyl-carrier-protein] synthase II
VVRPLRLLGDHLGQAGPRAVHFSACAAGAAAVGHAADLIRRGETTVALAGAADSMVHPFGLLPFILLGATSLNTDPETAARPFDQSRDGFVMGEGGAFFVLEPLSRARAAGRRVYGLLKGHGTSSDAFNVTAPHPEGAGAERAMRRALEDARLPASAIGYINAHGTGTPLNDTIEALAIRRVFGDRAPPVSSSKAQFGHTIAAAGAVELLASLAAIAGERLPPNPTLRQVDSRIDLDLVERTGRPARVEAVLSNSFGFGGQNACLVVAHPDAAGRG